MKIFDYANYRLTLNMPEILLVPEFKEVMDSDKSKNKDKAFAIFAYCYLMVDWQSPFRSFGEKEKHNESVKASGITEDDLEGELLKNCLQKYISILENNIILKLIWKIQGSVERFADYFEQINFKDEKVDTKQYLHTVKESKNIIDTLKALENKAKEEMYAEDVSTYGDVDKGFFN